MRLSAIGFFLITASLHAEIHQPANFEVGHDYWTSKDGAPGDIQALAQTNDGFLWLGSATGLFRFDGTRFERFKPPFGGQLLSTNVMCLLAPPSGGLWIGYTFGGVSFLDNGRVTSYALEAPVRHFARNRNGIVWAATSAGVWKFDVPRERRALRPARRTSRRPHPNASAANRDRGNGRAVMVRLAKRCGLA
jgi:hypothetical protein